MTNDYRVLTSRDHWLGWLGDEPGPAVRGEIEGILRQQVPSAQLDWLRLVGDPDFLTGGRKSPVDPNQIIVSRAALAVPFELQVSSETGCEQLRGVFSWVTSDLDSERRDRVFLDLDADIEWASQALKLRIYEIDLEAGDPEDEKETAAPPQAPWWTFWRR